MSDAARRILLAIFILGLAGISLELWLLAHTEDVYQLIPLWLAAAAIVASVVVALRPTPGTIRLFQTVMVLFLLSGVVGMWLHFQVNMEFQLEMDPALAGAGAVPKIHPRQVAASSGAGRDDPTGADWISLYIPPPGARATRVISVRGSRQENRDMLRTLSVLLIALVCAAPSSAQVGKSLGIVDANTVSEADLAKMPGMTPAIAKALVAARPFDSITALNTLPARAEADAGAGERALPRACSFTST